MRITLEAVGGPHAGKRMLLRSGQTLSVGRTEWADVALANDGYLSSVHFVVTCDDEACHLRDQGSSNGTFVNDQRVSEATLSDGDKIRAGGTLFLACIDQEQVKDFSEVEPNALEGQSKERSGPYPNRPAPSEPTIVMPPSRGAVQSPAPVAGGFPGHGATAPVVPMLATGLQLIPADASPPFRAGLTDADPGVRWEAILAAAWTRQPWLLEYCRVHGTQPSLDALEPLRLLALLGTHQDLPQIRELGRNRALGTVRFELLAAYGHPQVVGDLLLNLTDPDPATAIAAGIAFTRTTGMEIDSGEPVTLAPAAGGSAGEPAADLSDEAILPDVKLAQRHWSSARDRYAGSSRIRQGFDISGKVAPELLDQLDLQSRWEMTLRDRYEGRSRIRLAEWLAFPAARLS